MSREDTKQILINRLYDARKKAQSRRQYSYPGLREIRPRLDMRETAARLADIRHQPHSNTFSLIVTDHRHALARTLPLTQSV